MNQNGQTKQLQDLSHEIQQIEKEIEIRRDRIQLFKTVSDTHNHIQLWGGIYRRLEKLPDYETKWKDSFWGKNRFYIEKHGGFTLHPDDLAYARNLQKNHLLYDHENPIRFACIVYVQSISPTPNGLLFVIKDPFDTVSAIDKSGMAMDIAETYVGTYGIAKLGVTHKDSVIIMNSYQQVYPKKQHQ